MRVSENVGVALCIVAFAATIFLALIYSNRIPLAALVIAAVVLGLGLLFGAVLGTRG
jgi:hypothetical protein